ncbi:hypothetical protein SKAU_G00013860 [Synaphobranchus kaupii]|uniref:Uncharacterized protein n=1 Tax=Synaphobranchus kaupii TaxID=118154 RepID=A0A9Q1JCG4_SYNKA|nr:hypothetical protein SKAU_G00013860 [Synaphobranchus kaupii]
MGYLYSQGPWDLPIGDLIWAPRDRSRGSGDLQRSLVEGRTQTGGVGGWGSVVRRGGLRSTEPDNRRVLFEDNRNSYGRASVPQGSQTEPVAPSCPGQNPRVIWEERKWQTWRKLEPDDRAAGREGNKPPSCPCRP